MNFERRRRPHMRSMVNLNYRKARRYLGSFLATNRNRLSHRSFVPHPRRAIFIETSARCNLACRFCLYDKIGPGSFMDYEHFLHAVGEVTGLGFEFIWLTPMIGEVFADPGIIKKFEALEAEPKVEGFSFYSNLIMPKARVIADLDRFKKLTKVHVSIYGFDEDSFTLTTRKPAIQFRKFEENLAALFEVSRHGRAEMNFSIRTIATGKPHLEMSTPLTALLKRFINERGANISTDGEYDDWAGTILPEDVSPLGIELSNGKDLYKQGACTRIFNEVKIKVDGQVSACAPRDVDGSLVVGNINETPLRHILSVANPGYRKIIEDQMANDFPEVCRACAIYRSVYDHRSQGMGAKINTIDFDSAIELMSR